MFVVLVHVELEKVFVASPKSRKQRRLDPILRPLVQPRLLRRPHAAAYLSISPSQLDLLRARGEIDPVPVPSDRSPTGIMQGAILFDRADLDALIERWKESSADGE